MHVPRRKPKASFDWNRFAKYLFVLGLAGLIWIYVPAMKCSFSAADAVELNSNVSEEETFGNSVNNSYGADRTHDVARVDGASEFTGDFVGGVGPCFGHYSFGTADEWLQYATLGLLGGGVLFALIGNLTGNQRRT